jgi:hypothetical protein
METVALVYMSVGLIYAIAAALSLPNKSTFLDITNIAVRAFCFWPLIVLGILVMREVKND